MTQSLNPVVLYSFISTFCRNKNYSTPALAVPHYRSFAYYRLLKQENAVAKELLDRIYASDRVTTSNDDHKTMYENSFDELMGKLKKGNSNEHKIKTCISSTIISVYSTCKN